MKRLIAYPILAFILFALFAGAMLKISLEQDIERFNLKIQQKQMEYNMILGKWKNPLDDD